MVLLSCFISLLRMGKVNPVFCNEPKMSSRLQSSDVHVLECIGGCRNPSDLEHAKKEESLLVRNDMTEGMVT